MLGVTRAGLNGFDPNVPTPPQVLAQFEAALNAMTAAGATLVTSTPPASFFPGNGEVLVLCFDFRNDVKNYSLPGSACLWRAKP